MAHFLHIYMTQEDVQLQVSIELETLRSRVRCVPATLTSCNKCLTFFLTKDEHKD